MEDHENGDADMEDHENGNLVADVIDALRVVIDPELGENVVDLGLIYDVVILEGDIAEIEMTTTSKGCPATSYLKEAVANAAWSVEGVQFAQVRLTYEPPWMPEMMSENARQRLGMIKAGTVV